MRRQALATIVARIGFSIASASASAQRSTTDEIARYRQMIQDGNPAELFEAKGEVPAWKESPPAPSFRPWSAG